MSPTAFGRYVHSKRVAAGLSMRQLAEHLGISHVFLGEVERGRQRKLAEKYWPRLVEVVPGITLSELQATAQASAPISIDPLHLDESSQDLAVTFSRRLENRDLSSTDIQKLLTILNRSPNDE